MSEPAAADALPQIDVSIDPAELDYAKATNAMTYVARWVEGKKDGKMTVEQAAGNGLMGLVDMKGTGASTDVDDSADATSLSQTMKEIACEEPAESVVVPENGSQEVVVQMDVRADTTDEQAVSANEDKVPKTEDLEITTDYKEEG